MFAVWDFQRVRVSSWFGFGRKYLVQNGLKFGFEHKVLSAFGQQLRNSGYNYYNNLCTSIYNLYIYLK